MIYLTIILSGDVYFQIITTVNSHAVNILVTSHKPEPNRFNGKFFKYDLICVRHHFLS